MNKSRGSYIYQLIGQINSKGQRTAKHEKYHGTYYYQLNVSIENKEVKKIFVFPTGLEKATIWKELENNDYLGKKYVFFCKNHMGNYRLINWEKVNDHGSN